MKKSSFNEKLLNSHKVLIRLLSGFFNIINIENPIIDDFFSHENIKLYANYENREVYWYILKSFDGVLDVYMGIPLDNSYEIIFLLLEKDNHINTSYYFIFDLSFRLHLNKYNYIFKIGILNDNKEKTLYDSLLCTSFMHDYIKTFINDHNLYYFFPKKEINNESFIENFNYKYFRFLYHNCIYNTYNNHNEYVFLNPYKKDFSIKINIVFTDENYKKTSLYYIKNELKKCEEIPLNDLLFSIFFKNKEKDYNVESIKKFFSKGIRIYSI